jgi:hypothetical protein
MTEQCDAQLHVEAAMAAMSGECLTSNVTHTRPHEIMLTIDVNEWTNKRIAERKLR